ncbi:hypothetical protein GO613_13880 [Azoarcus communis]|uniref:hypothetical protein n=1 Tax=Parazoarcus communis TaxID=41977 RepID=UPI0014591C9B|nr:hypothetical protein [Parazoarcus communis]NMG49193.1 hypothetical protein [Parazoarcus communis]
MAQAICFKVPSAVDYTAYGCAPGYAPVVLPKQVESYQVGAKVSTSFNNQAFQIVDIGVLELGGSSATGATQTTGVFDVMPVQDVIVVAFLFVMFGLGFIGGLNK